MRTRDFRRYQSHRVKKKFYKSLRNYDWMDDEWSEIRARSYNTRACCSCYMCGNPRRHWKEKTMQERRAEEAFILEDLKYIR